MADATSQQEPAHKLLRIKKYPNRRYYDGTHSRHVTLEEIYSLIREGYEVQATDSKTGDDITAKVLAQIIIELDTPKLGVFPVPLLHRLLRSNERLVGDFIDKYFNQPLSQFLDSQRSIEQYFRQAMGLHTPAPTVADLTKLIWGLPRAAPSGGAAAAAVPSGDANHESDLRKLVHELRQEIGELRTQGQRQRRRQQQRQRRPADKPASPRQKAR